MTIQKGPRRSAARRLLGMALAAALGPAPGPVAAQGPGEAAQDAATFRERIEVELVNVDVWVSDRQGDPVPGLGVESFEVFHDGEPVKITHFAEIRGGVVAGPRAEGVEGGGGQELGPMPAEPTHLVVYVDQSRLHPTHVEPLTSALGELLASGAVEPGRVLVLSQGRGLSVEAPFGSSAEQLRQTLARVAKGGGEAIGATLDTDARLALDAIQVAWEQAQDAAGSAAGGIAMVPDQANPAGQPVPGGSPRARVGGVGGGGGPDACGMFVNQVRPTLDAWARSRGQRLELTLANLADSVGFLAGLPGVKMLLYLSDGLDSRPGSDLFTYAQTLCPAVGAELLSGSRLEDATERLLELTRHANAHRVTIHSLQASGLISPGAAAAASERGTRGGGSQRASGTFEATKRSIEREGLDLIARETGGRAVFDRNDLGPELARIAEASRSYYSLAYEPPSGTGESEGHRIKVELDDGSLVTRYRHGYREESAPQRLGERVEGALNLGITSNPLDVRLGAGGPEPAAEGKVRIPLHVIVPAERLTFVPRDAGEWIAEVTVKVLARAVDGDALALRDQTFRLKGAPGAAGRVDLPVVLELDAGAYLTAVGVRDDASLEASFISTVLDARGAP